MKRNIFIGFLLATVLGFGSCEKKETGKSAQILGLWEQESITEDGVEMNLPPEQKALSLLIESNGVYRTYAKDAVQKEHFGAWTVTDNTWFEITADKWVVSGNSLSSKKWAKNHVPVRFTLLEVSNNRLQIRIKTFAGERKYAALFIENPLTEIPEIPELEADMSNEDAVAQATANRQAVLDAIQEEYQQVKTYIYTFKKITDK